jgi:hypothetical protein
MGSFLTTFLTQLASEQPLLTCVLALLILTLLMMVLATAINKTISTIINTTKITVRNGSSSCLVIVIGGQPYACPAGQEQRLRVSRSDYGRFQVTDGAVKLTFYRGIDLDLEHHGWSCRWKDGVLSINNKTD